MFSHPWQELDIIGPQPHLGRVEFVTLSIGIIGLGMAALSAFLFRLMQAHKQEAVQSQQALNEKVEECAAARKELEMIRQSLAHSTALEKELREQILKSETDNARQTSQIDELQRRLKDQLAEQEKSALQLQERFENLANKIFEQKSAKFSDLNQEKLKVVLQPLDKDIREFRKKVEEIHEKDSHQHVALREFVAGLQKAQTQLSEDARNLTQALKGDSKKQGDWGEFILERALEASGLTKDQEFSMQSSFDGKRPDAIIHLPGERQLIIDAKVSLTAYERSISAENEDDRKQARKEHLQSMRKHIDELSEKDYSSIEELTCPDFTLLFIPVEPAFGAALAEDSELYQYAFDRKIALITASTLMATIKTVANLWKLEKQNKHAQDIAKRAGLLFDKFSGFLSNLEEVGKSLGKAVGAHERAVGQLSSGPGNLIGQAEKLKAMGIRSKKEIPSSFLENQVGGETEDQSEIAFDRDESERESA
jgi:DNA recombination protein RmuC